SSRVLRCVLPSSSYAADRRLHAHHARRGALQSTSIPGVVLPVFPVLPPYRDHSPMGVGLESFPASVRSSIDLSACRRRCAFPVGPALFPCRWRLAGASPFLSPCAPWTGRECRSHLRRAWPPVGPQHQAGSPSTRRSATAFRTASASRAACPPDTVRRAS